MVVLRDRADLLLVLGSCLSSCSCLASNISDETSMVVSGHGVRLAGTTTSKGGSITHLQKKNLSYYSLKMDNFNLGYYSLKKKKIEHA